MVKLKLRDSKFKMGDHVAFKNGNIEYFVNGVELDVQNQKFTYELLAPTKSEDEDSKVLFDIDESRLVLIRALL